MGKKTQTQATEEVQQPQESKSVQCTFKMPAARFQDAIKAVEAISGYGLDSQNEHAEAYLHITENGIECTMMDKSRVMMVEMAINKSQLSDFNAESTGFICFQTSDLLRTLKGVKREIYNADGTTKTEGDMLVLAIADPEAHVELKHSEYNRNWKINSMSPERADMETPVPNLKPTAMFKADVKQLLRRFVDAAMASEHVTISADEKGVTFDAKDETASYHSTLAKSDNLTDYDMQQPAKAGYNIDVLLTLLKALPKDAETITWRFANDMPVQIDVACGIDKLVFYLAPRIEID